MKFSVILKKPQVEAAYQAILKKSAVNVKLQGFRKGKAPLNLVESSLDQGKLREQAIQDELPKAYVEEIKAKKLEPIGYPKLEFKTLTKSGDLEFEAEIATKPKVTLGAYQAKLKKFKPVIAKPDSKSTNPTPPPTQAQQIVDLLIDTAKIEIPTLLVEQERNRMLNQLTTRLKNLKVNLDDFLKTSKKTREDLFKDYEVIAEKSLKTEFILDEIADNLKINVTKLDKERFISTLPDQKTKDFFNQPDQEQNINYSLRKQLTLEALTKLVPEPKETKEKPTKPKSKNK